MADDVTKVYCCKKWENGVLKKYMSPRMCKGDAVLCSAADPPNPDEEGGGDGQVHCCKKWINGVLKKFNSPTPCSGTAVKCSDPDPPKPPIVDQKDCEEKCHSNQQYLLLKGPKPAEAAAMLKACLDKCQGIETTAPCTGGVKRVDATCPTGFHSKKDEASGVWYCCPDSDPLKPCGEKEGYELQGTGLQKCNEGYTLTRSSDGKNWCCKDDTVTPGGNPCDEGGYQLTQENGFAGGVGEGQSPWAEIPGTTRSGDWEGHYVWNAEKGKYVNIHTPDIGVDLVCKKGWLRKSDSEGGIWCCPDPNGDDDGDGDDLGEFKWDEGLQALLGRIQDRANELLDYPRGLRPEERQAVINYAIEGVKAGEAGEKQQSRDELARMGMLGSGFEASESARITRETRQESGDVRRELAIDELNRRFAELMGTTGMAQGLTGTLMESQQIPEILSAGRRSEGSAAMNAFLQYLGMGNQGSSGYNEAIMAQLFRGGDKGGDMSWLYYLPYLIK